MTSGHALISPTGSVSRRTNDSRNSKNVCFDSKLIEAQTVKISKKYEEFIDTIKAQLKISKSENHFLKEQLIKEQEKSQKLTKDFAKEVENVIGSIESAVKKDVSTEGEKWSLKMAEMLQSKI